jgi:hypothetical protein
MCLKLDGAEGGERGEGERRNVSGGVKMFETFQQPSGGRRSGLHRLEIVVTGFISLNI